MKTHILILSLCFTGYAQAAGLTYKVSPEIKDKIAVDPNAALGKTLRTSMDMTMRATLPSRGSQKTVDGTEIKNSTELDIKLITKGEAKERKIQFEFRKFRMDVVPHGIAKQQMPKPVVVDISKVLKGEKLTLSTNKEGKLTSVEGLNELRVKAQTTIKDERQKEMALKMISDELVTQLAGDYIEGEDREAAMNGRAPGDEWETSIYKNGQQTTGKTKFVGWDNTQKSPRAVLVFHSPRAEVVLQAKDKKESRLAARELTTTSVINPKTSESLTHTKMDMDQLDDKKNVIFESDMELNITAKRK